jgi:hypothetical protein
MAALAGQGLNMSLIEQCTAIFQNQGVCPLADEDLLRLQRWIEKGQRGEPLAIVSPVCPDYSAAPGESRKFRFTFESVGTGAGLACLRLFQSLTALRNLFGETLQLPNIEHHVLVGDFEAFSEQNCQRVGLSTGDFVDRLRTSCGTISMQAPAPVAVGLFTDCIGGRPGWERVYEEMNAAFPRDTIYVSTIGLSQIAGAQFLHVYGPRQWINCGQAGPLGWTVPAALGVVAADPTKTVVGLAGDYDFQFLIEELAVGAQFELPYVQVVVNNSYLGLIRQAQRGFNMDYCVQLAFENKNTPEEAGDVRHYGVDHVKVAEGLGCKALRVTDPGKLEGALREAQALAHKHRVPVVVECILEKVTNIAMGTEINAINEFEEIECRHPEGQKGLALARLLD